MFTRLVASSCCLALWCMLGFAGQPQLPDDSSKALPTPLTQEEIDVYITQILPTLLEMRYADNTQDNVEAYVQKLQNLGVPQPRLSVIVKKMNQANAVIQNLTDMEQMIATPLAPDMRLTPEERELVLSNADRINQAFSTTVKAISLPIPPGLMGSDAGAVEAYLFITIMKPAGFDPDLHLRMLLDICPPHRKGLWGAIIPALAASSRGQAAAGLQVLDSVIRRYPEELEPTLAAFLTWHKGLILLALGDTTGAVAFIEQAEQASQHSEDPTLQRIASLCRIDKTLPQKDYEAIIRASNEIQDPLLQRRIADILSRLGQNALLENDTEATIRMIDTLVAHYAASDDPAMLQHVVTAMAAKANIYANEGNTADAIALLSAIATKVADREEPYLSRYAIAALDQHASIMEKSGDIDAAFVLWDSIMSRYSTVDKLSSAVAITQFTQAEALERHERSEQAITAYQSVVDMLQDSTDKQDKMFYAVAQRKLKTLAQ